MNDGITSKYLRQWRKSEGMTQSDLGDMIGLDKVTIAKIETGRRKISEAEQRLLKLLIKGELPFPAPINDSTLEFGEQEWAVIHKMAQREGFSSGRQWIVSKIRAYLAQLPKHPISRSPKKHQKEAD